MNENFKFPIPFSEKELVFIRRHYCPENPNFDQNYNRIWAKPVKDILVPRFKREVKELENILGFTPKAAMVMVGDDPASRSYVENLSKLLARCGIRSEEYEIAASSKQSDFNELMTKFRKDNQLIGAIPQLPLPDGFSEEEVRMTIPSNLDIDGLHPNNIMKFAYGNAPLLPATIGGVAMAMKAYGISLSEDGKDKNIALLGQGKLGGYPLVTLFSRIYQKSVLSINENGQGLPERLKKYDILISATGHTNVYDERVINPERKQVLLDIDFGYENGEFVGGFTKEAHSKAYESMRNPGGSGLFTQLYAVHNILTLAERKARESERNFELYT